MEEEMILERILKEGLDLNLPKELLEKAHIMGRINIVVEEDEITIRKASGKIGRLEEMAGLGKGIFKKDSVSLQRELRGEWKL